MTQITNDLTPENLDVQNTWYDSFLSKTPQEVEDWIDLNVNDLNSAKTVLKKLARVVVILAKSEMARRT